MSRRRLRRAGRGDRGASAVEFAIVVPVLLLILLGILEFAFVFRDYLSVSSAVRVGTRTASSGAGAREAVCPYPLPVGMTACTGSDTPQLAQSAADAIQRAGTTMNQDIIDEIWVYRANTSGFPANSVYVSSANPNNTTGATTQDAALAQGCNTACVKYRWNDALNKFQYTSGTWDYKTINGCIADADAVGVYMKATHPFFTKFIRDSLTMSDRSVMTFEPLPAGQCAPGAHN
jgi:hypothetical protein